MNLGYFFLNVIWYLLFVFLSVITLGAIDIEIEFTNGKKLNRTGWISFVFGNR